MRILVNPDQLRQSAEQVNRASGDLQGIGNRVGRALSGMSLEIRLRSNVDGRVAAARRQAMSLARQAESLARFLVDRADAFERADRQGVAALALQSAGLAGLLGVLGAAAGGIFGRAISDLLTRLGGLLGAMPAAGSSRLLAQNQAGSALGTSASTMDWESMSWKERIIALGELNRQIAELEGRIPEGMTLEQVNQELSAIENQIAQLEQGRNAAQDQAGKWWNQVFPTWPPGSDSDGVPWRVRADTYEDQVAQYDQQLDALQQQRDRLLGYQSDLETLNQLQQNQTTLNQVIQQGIPPDGPTQPAWLKQQLGGCTHYVAERRNVYDWPSLVNNEPGHPANAQYWNDQAVAAGYEVGEYPVKGSIMVFEPNVLGSHSTAGHVAYVEGVSSTADGGYTIHITEAGTAYHANGNFIRGTHTTPGSRDITVYVRDGQVYNEQGQSLGVSFIYDKQEAI